MWRVDSSGIRRSIRRLLQDQPGLTASAIARRVAAHPDSVLVELRRLRRSGQIQVIGQVLGRNRQLVDQLVWREPVTPMDRFLSARPPEVAA